MTSHFRKYLKSFSIAAAAAMLFTPFAAVAQTASTTAGNDRWLHVRGSNTEPVVRLIAEAPSEVAAQKLIAEARLKLQVADK